MKRRYGFNLKEMEGDKQRKRDRNGTGRKKTLGKKGGKRRSKEEKDLNQIKKEKQ